jgi:hypothetical protein
MASSSQPQFLTYSSRRGLDESNSKDSPDDGKENAWAVAAESAGRGLSIVSSISCVCVTSHRRPGRGGRPSFGCAVAAHSGKECHTTPPRHEIAVLRGGRIESDVTPP